MQASQGRFSAGEQVVIEARLTNLGKDACRVAGVPDGALTILSVSKDGLPITPTVSESEFIDGFTTMIRANAVVVAAGESVTLSLQSDSAATMSSSTVGDGDSALVLTWPVAAPGKYEILAGYRMPPIQFPNPPACQIIGNPVPVDFTVAGS